MLHSKAIGYLKVITLRKAKLLTVQKIVQLVDEALRGGALMIASS
jgi:hypothetical protein